MDGSPGDTGGWSDACARVPPARVGVGGSTSEPLWAGQRLFPEGCLLGCTVGGRERISTLSPCTFLDEMKLWVLCLFIG